MTQHEFPAPGSPVDNDTDEISLKELIANIRELIAYFFAHKGLLFLLGVLGAAAGFGYAHFTKKITYESRLTFVVEEKSGSNLSGLASQFGLDIGGGSSNLFTSDNLMVLLKSNRILQAALLQPQQGLEEGNLLNLYLRIQFEKALEDEKLQLIPVELERNKFSLVQDSILKIATQAVASQITINKIDKKAPFTEIVVKSTNEDFAWIMGRMLIEEATNLYLDLKTGKMRRSVAILEARRDSVERVMNAVMSSAAADRDQSLGILQALPRVNSAKKEMQAQMLATLYGELTKNLELAKLTLDREEPTIEIIDLPSKPLTKIGKGRVKTGAIGGFVALFLGLGWLYIRRIIA